MWIRRLCELLKPWALRPAAGVLQGGCANPAGYRTDFHFKKRLKKEVSGPEKCRDPCAPNGMSAMLMPP